ncbi:MAG: hypothetical protein K2N65_04870, partial [Anaeroplasmataceae bacterium]|nr:hypothetical protein [Anaeroplasmataceae bacterium]
SNPYVICIGICFFNFSMPITLYYANCLLKKKEGLAFGLLAAVLMPGYLLGMLEYPMLGIQIAVGILCVLSIGCILFIEWRIRKNGTY